MFKKILGNPTDEYKIPEMKIETLRAYNPKDIDDLHKKFIELSNQLTYEECQTGYEAITTLMHVYAQAIDRLLQPMPIFNFPIHPNTDDFDLLGGEKAHVESYFTDIKKATKEKLDKKGD